MSRQFGRALDTFVPPNTAIKLNGFAGQFIAKPLAVGPIGLGAPGGPRRRSVGALVLSHFLIAG
jgi:hypothetical protein